MRRWVEFGWLVSQQINFYEYVGCVLCVFDDSSFLVTCPCRIPFFCLYLYNIYYIHAHFDAFELRNLNHILLTAASCEDLSVPYSDTSEVKAVVGDSVVVTCTGGTTSNARCVPDGNKNLGTWRDVPKCEGWYKPLFFLTVGFWISAAVDPLPRQGTRYG